MASFFEVENLTKRFGGLTALNKVSLQIARDEIVGLIGPNGSGKTTLIRCILGILKPDSGRVQFKEKNVTRQSTWSIVNRGIAGTFQVVKPFRRLPVIANVMVGCLCPRARRSGEWVKRLEIKARDALEFCGIADLAMEPASILSHGDLKRLEMARAIATEPELLLLDEPFGGLNPAETDLLAKSIKRLHQGGRFGRLHVEGPAVLIVEHKLPDLMKIVDRIVVLNFGQLIAQGTPKEVVGNKQVQEAYLGKKVFQLAS
ncbi:MAG: transporter related [Deltaproteobacteria bacterium]|nr:transporter related [Deltaproteobacteria bacterium]